MIWTYHHYPSYLKAVLADRVRTNPLYSLRAMAKNLELAPSLLSDILKGKRHLTAEGGLRAGRRLGLSGLELEYFYLMVQLEGAKDPELREILLRQLSALNTDNKPRDLSVDHFKMIGDWYHLAILELFEMKSFVVTAESTAAHLMIPLADASEALERLERLDLIGRDSKGALRRQKGTVRFASKPPNDAIRKFHRQTVQLGLESLESQTNAEKFIGTETLAFDSSQLPRANALFEECFEKLLKLSDSQPTKREIYHLNINFFRMGKKSSRASKKERA